MSDLRRCAMMLLTGLTCVSSTVSAYADDPPAGFIPLHGVHTDARGKAVAPVRNASAAFLPLTARNFRGLPKASRELPLEDAEPVVMSENFSRNVEERTMSDEQAQQIISIFDPGL